ncbi:hypothetical protein [Nitrobacter sp.]|uniref:hypothetical protein n=1 Tax=Nitrobacter sp. TaxID=29420 RepID=UPI0029CAB7E7|nr:hypothetical protein [Nitrobacter sp.]
MTDFDAVITKLQAWTEFDFHTDRQLADEILIADGWCCEPDQAFGGGFRWWCKNGAVTYSSSETHRPHPIIDMNAAVALIPHGAGWNLSSDHGGAICSVRIGALLMPGTPTHVATGYAKRTTVAVCLAAMTAKKLLAEHQRLQSL